MLERVGLLAALIFEAFLIGSIPFGYVIGKFAYGIDLRASGSGNIGAANALRSLGRGGAAAVLVMDALKGIVPVRMGFVFGNLAGPHYGSPIIAGAHPELWVAGMCGLAAIAGHCFSPWMRWRGGKGVATNLGVTFALWPPAGIIFIVIWLGLALAFGYSSLGSLVASIAMIAVLGYAIGAPGAAYAIVAAALIVFLHRENIERLRAGNERRISLFAKPPSRREDESRGQAS